MNRLFLVIALLLVGCPAGEQARQLREGMTRDQVIAVMGQPDGFQKAGDRVGFQYTNRLISGWSWDRADYYAIFENDRLAAWGPGEVRTATGPNIGTLVVIPVQ